MKTVLLVSLVVCVIQIVVAGPLQQQVKLDPSKDLVQEPQSDLVQVTESKVENFPEENEESVPSVQIDEDELTTVEPIPEMDERDETEQEVEQVQQQVFDDVQVVTTPGENSDEDLQSTERSEENQSNESWFCSVFGCYKS